MKTFLIRTSAGLTFAVGACLSISSWAVEGDQGPPLPPAVPLPGPNAAPKAAPPGAVPVLPPPTQGVPTEQAPAPRPAGAPAGVPSYSPGAPTTPGALPPQGGPIDPAPSPVRPAAPYQAGYQPDSGIDPSLYYSDSGAWGGRYPQPVGSPYYYSPDWSYNGGNAYDVHFGPGFYRSGEYGHLRFPYYSYRRPWYFPGPAVYARDTNLSW